MANFSTSVDIINRGMQRVGAQRIASLTEDTKRASEAVALYDKLRRAELRRNPWRFSIRRTVIRGLNTPLPEWDEAITYSAGAYVRYNNVNYVALLGTNLNKNPEDEPTYWSIYTGFTSLKITPSAWSGATTYAIGALVTGSDNLLYTSLQASNLNHDPTTDTSATYWMLYFGSVIATAWDEDSTYSIGELVFDANDNTIFASTMMNNDNDPSTGTGWATIACTKAPPVIPWPAGTDAARNGARNIFMLPNGYLRQVPLDPRAGEVSVLGYPSNLMRDDWLLEGNVIVSRDPGPIMLRFVADVTQVGTMDDMFCEGLACRIALELCETLTQSSGKLRDLGALYKTFMGDARLVNGIEVAASSPPMDDYISTRA